MKRLFTFVIAGALLTGSAYAIAAPQDDHGNGHDKHWDDRDHGDDYHGHKDKDKGKYKDKYEDEDRHDNGKHKGWEKQAYRRGDRLPDRYYEREYYVTDYERYHVRRPEPGYRWVRDDEGQLVLTAIATGIIVDIAIQP